MKKREFYANKTYKIPKLSKKSIKIIFLFFILSSTTLNFLYSSYIDSSENIDEDGNNIDPIMLKMSQYGEDSWWHASWKYRQCINITNPYNIDLIDYMVSIKINHTELLQKNQIRSDLGDVRIVENGILRNYYFSSERPDGDFAYVWFETTINASSIEYDAYIYYGNDVATPDPTYYRPEREGIAWWGFEDGQGVTALDLIGNNDGTLINMGPSNWQSGKIGEYCLDFDGSTEYVTIGTDPIPSSGAFSISLWFNSRATSGILYDMTLGDKYFYIRLDNGQIGWEFEDSIDTDCRIYYNIPNLLNNWHQVVVVAEWNGNIQYIYIDGERVTTANPNILNKPSLSTPFIGYDDTAYMGPYPNFNGFIDDIRIYNYGIALADMNWLYTNYTLTSELLGEQERAAKVIITIRDVDGRPVPNAEVSLVNNTAPLANRTIITLDTSDMGIVNFENIPFGEYNVTVNYTLKQGGIVYEDLLYDSAELVNGALNFFGLFCNETIYVDIWSIDFEVDDWEEDPMDYGYVLVYNNSNSDPLLANLTLGTGTGINTFRWLNRSHYYYEMYYYNEDYLVKKNFLDSATIYRESKLNSTTFFVNETAELSGGSVYRSIVNIYAENSSASNIGKNKIIAIDINIELEKIINHLVSLDVQYLASDNTWKIVEEGSKIYGTSDTSDTIHLNIIDKYEAYGIKSIVNFFNSTPSNGIITINYNETTQVYEKAQMSKLRIYTFDKSSENQPIQYMIVKVVNSTGHNIVNLVTDSNGLAKGYNNDLPFWYFHGDYNFSLSFYGSNKSFLVSQSDKYFDPAKEYYDLDPYNYTLDGLAILNFNVTINIEDYQSRFQDTVGISEINWGEMMYFEVNYTIKTPILDWTPIQNPTYVRYEIYKLGTSIVVRSGDMAPGDNGNYSLQLNSDVLIGSEWYKIRIFGRKIGYIDPYDVNFDFRVIGVNTGILLHDYNTKDIIISNRTSEYFTQSINITLSYFVAGETSNRISEAILTYNIPGIPGESGIINEDPLSMGYYTFLFDTAIVTNVGQYLIEITANKDNYTKIDDYEIILDIDPIPTALNGTSRVKIIDDIPVLSEKFYIFEYYDTINDARITDCETKYYEWNKLDEDGNFLYGPGNEGVDFLIETVDDLYILDFDTETREIATYSIAVYFEKQNYLIKFADLTITIVPRPIDDDLIRFPSRQLNIKQGVKVVIQLNIVDKITALPLTDVNVTLTIKGYNTISATYMGGGIYELIFSTSGIDTFFTPKSLSAEIIIEKENYEIKSWVFNIVVGMTEIFPGFPLFYFLMILIGVGAVVGSLVGYRSIQVARIPEFIKKSRKIKKEIKSGKSISDSNLYPPKEHFLADLLGDKWKKLGLSLEDILGTKGKKTKKYKNENETGGVK